MRNYCKPCRVRPWRWRRGDQIFIGTIVLLLVLSRVIGWPA
jgi:hypothetical protein